MAKIELFSAVSAGPRFRWVVSNFGRIRVKPIVDMDVPPFTVIVKSPGALASMLRIGGGASTDCIVKIRNDVFNDGRLDIEQDGTATVRADHVEHVDQHGQYIQQARFRLTFQTDRQAVLGALRQKIH